MMIATLTVRLQTCAWLRHRASAYEVRLQPCFLAMRGFRRRTVRTPR